MASINANIARRMITIADPRVPRDELLAIAGLRSTRPTVGHESSISDAAYYSLIERAIEGGDATFPLRYGDAVEPGTLGAFGHAVATAPTVHESLRRLVRYIRVVSDSLEYDLLEQRSGAALHLIGRTGERRGIRVSNECALAAVASVLRQIAVSPIAPRRVTFQHPAQAGTSEHVRWFGCPVDFDAPSTSLELSRESLSTPTRLGDAGLSAYLLAQLDDARADADVHSTTARTRAAVADTLCDGAPSKQEVARRLGMSERTLHRRLEEEGTAFQRLLDDVRREIAESLLTEGRRPLGEVAYFTGFADQTAFTRAFKRWTGRTPLQHRQAGATPDRG